jgi:hypothetical protein
MMLRCGKIFGIAGLLLVCIMAAGSALGQDKPVDPTPKRVHPMLQPEAVSDQSQAASPDLTVQQDENSKRILGMIPNFQTKNDKPAEYEPMSNGQPHYGQG